MITLWLSMFICHASHLTNIATSISTNEPCARSWLVTIRTGSKSQQITSMFWQKVSLWLKRAPQLRNNSRSTNMYSSRNDPSLKSQSRLTAKIFNPFFHRMSRSLRCSSWTRILKHSCTGWMTILASAITSRSARGDWSSRNHQPKLSSLSMWIVNYGSLKPILCLSWWQTRQGSSSALPSLNSRHPTPRL